MGEKDISRIKVGRFAVGITGIAQLMDEMARTHADKTDNEVGCFMLERLGQGNYIPSGAREDYGKAFVREFRKFLGQPCAEDDPRGLDIKVLGVGCSQCHNLSQMIVDLLTELELPAGFEHVTDIGQIARYGIMGSPALLINGKAVSVGSVPPKNRVRKWLVEAGRSLGVKQ